MDAFKFIAPKALLAIRVVGVAWRPKGLVSQRAGKNVGIVGGRGQMVVRKQEIIVQMQQGVGVDFHGVIEIQFFKHKAGKVEERLTLAIIHILTKIVESRERETSVVSITATPSRQQWNIFFFSLLTEYLVR
jgi:hypothetical protein